jgi:hypothetical protein
VFSHKLGTGQAFQHDDRIGLLKPAARSQSGQRLQDAAVCAQRDA